MRKQILIVLAAALLMTGIPAVAATGVWHPTEHSFGSTPSDLLLLTRAQQKTAWRDLHKRLRDQYGPPGFSTLVGWGLQPAVTVRPVTRKAARNVPALRPYDFAMVQGRLLIVNPSDMIIAEVIRSPRRGDPKSAKCRGLTPARLPAAAHARSAER